MRRTMILGLCLAALSAGQALAHAQLVRADPKVGSTVAAAPPRLWLRFDQAPRLAGSGVELTRPDGRSLILPLSRDPDDVRAVVAPLPSSLPAGRYHVRWRALSPDAHHSQGAFDFTLRAPAK